jgi:hypothetical protein
MEMRNRPSLPTTISQVKNVLRGDASTCIQKLALLEKLTRQVRQPLEASAAKQSIQSLQETA